MTLSFSLLRIKLFIFALLSCLGPTAWAQVELECDYYLNPYDEYSCQLVGIEVPTRETEVIFTGRHLPDYNETDVAVITIIFSDTPFIIPSIYTTFPNIIELNIEFSNLVEIDPIPEHIRLEYFIAYFNEIPVIRNETFATQSESLVYVELMLNGLEMLEENAFIGGENTVLLALRYNNLQEIHPRAFWPLTSVSLIDAGFNDLVRIEDDVFSQCQQLTSLNLEQNSLSEISPRFANGIRESLFIFNLGYNPCVDRTFILNEAVMWAFMHNTLQECYGNFVGDEQQTRSITIEFRGSLRLYDEDGNIVFMAN